MERKPAAPVGSEEEDDISFSFNLSLKKAFEQLILGLFVSHTPEFVSFILVKQMPHNSSLPLFFSFSFQIEIAHIMTRARLELLSYCVLQRSATSAFTYDMRT